MAKIKVHAGDFLAEDSQYSSLFENLFLKNKDRSSVAVSIKQLESVEVASEESVKKIGGTLGWGAAGGLLLGPVGLLAGLLLGGRKKEVTFVARFKDGRKLLATTDNATYLKLKAAVF